MILLEAIEAVYREVKNPNYDAKTQSQSSIHTEFEVITSIREAALSARNSSHNIKSIA